MAAGDRTEKRLGGPTQLGTSTTTLFTVPNFHTYVVKQIIIANTDTLDRLVTLSIGSSATAANHIISALPVGGNDIVVWDTALVVEGGETVQGLSDTGAKVNVTLVGWDRENVEESSS
jgi:hypothetical protein